MLCCPTQLPPLLPTQAMCTCYNNVVCISWICLKLNRKYANNVIISLFSLPGSALFWVCHSLVANHPCTQRYDHRQRTTATTNVNFRHNELSVPIPLLLLLLSTETKIILKPCSKFRYNSLNTPLKKLRQFFLFQGFQRILTLQWSCDRIYSLLFGTRSIIYLNISHIEQKVMLQTYILN